MSSDHLSSLSTSLFKKDMSKSKSSLGSLLDSSSSKPSRGSAATVGGDLNVKKIEKGEIYIRADGKKVRKIKKTVVRSSNSVADEDTVGEVYIRPDGKKVRRVKRTKSSASSVSPAPAKLGGFLNAGSSNITPRGSAATVSGPVSSRDEGEIIIRPDGKKVRRIKTTRSKGSPASVAADLSGAQNRPKVRVQLNSQVF